MQTTSFEPHGHFDETSTKLTTPVGIGVFQKPSAECGCKRLCRKVRFGQKDLYQKEMYFIRS